MIRIGETRNVRPALQPTEAGFIFEIDFPTFRATFRDIADYWTREAMEGGDYGEISEHQVERRVIRRIFNEQRRRDPEIVSYSRIGDGRIEVLVKISPTERNPDLQRRPILMVTADGNDVAAGRVPELRPHIQIRAIEGVNRTTVQLMDNDAVNQRQLEQQRLEAATEPGLLRISVLRHKRNGQSYTRILKAAVDYTTVRVDGGNAVSVRLRNGRGNHYFSGRLKIEVLPLQADQHPWTAFDEIVHGNIEHQFHVPLIKPKEKEITEQDIERITQPTIRKSREDVF